jgi:hypothetical protein
MSKGTVWYNQRMCLTSFTLLLLFVIATSVPAQQTNETKTNISANKIIISGNIVDKDGSPVTDIIIQLFEIAGNQLKFQVQDGNVIKNPKSTTDSQGKFTIDVDVSTLKPSAEYTIVMRPNERLTGEFYPLSDRDKKLIKLRFAGDIKNIDFGQVTLGGK